MAQDPTSSDYSSESAESPLKKINTQRGQEKTTVIKKDIPKFRDMTIEEEEREWIAKFTAKQPQRSKFVGTCQMESLQTDLLSSYKLSPRPLFAPRRFVPSPPKSHQVQDSSTGFKLTSPTLVDSNLNQHNDGNSQTKQVPLSNAIKATAFLNDKKKNQLILKRRSGSFPLKSSQLAQEKVLPSNQEAHHGVSFDDQQKQTDMLHDSSFSKNTPVYPNRTDTPSPISRSTEARESLLSEPLSLTEHPKDSTDSTLSSEIEYHDNDAVNQLSQLDLTSNSTNLIDGLALLSLDTRANASSQPSVVRPIARSQEVLFVNEQGYWMSPTHEQLSQMPLKDLKQVPNFIVGRKGFGKIEFMDPVNLSSAGMDNNWTNAIVGRIVVFTKRACALYPKAQFDGYEQKRPAQGQELNVHCKVYLEEVWCLTRDKKEQIKDPQHPMYQRHLERLKKIPNVEFEEFDAITGTWIFNCKPIEENC